MGDGKAAIPMLGMKLEMSPESRGGKLGSPLS